MGKKVGIIAAVVGGIILLCCLGGIFFARNVIGQLKETVAKNQTFVGTALMATAKNWDEKDFAIYADESFNKPENKKKTQELFATLKEKLGPIVSLGEIKPLRQNSFRTNDKGDNKGFFVKFEVPAKFQKRDGVFEVTVRNNRERQTIFAISLNPDSVSAADTGASNNTEKTGNNAP